MHSEQCPPLGVGSLDFDHIHAAARQGHDLDKAIDEAKTLPGDKDAQPDETVPHADTVAAPVTAEAAAALTAEAEETTPSAKRGK